MMKKILLAVLAFALMLSMAACGKKNDAAPDLNQYYVDFIDGLGEENAPMMMDVEGELLDTYYPGLNGYQTKQRVVKAAAISSVPYEFALVEAESAADAEAIAEIFRSRIDSQTAGGAYYPMTIEAWENAAVLTNGNIAALICAGDTQAEAETGFNALF
ncbi:MAG: DUF4358 domain-containing protein [Oscillospiraceae bacterium]|nr:DUF4358 domain-containing protein [Oscillospiraceae bacterium]